MTARDEAVAVGAVEAGKHGWEFNDDGWAIGCVCRETAPDGVGPEWMTEHQTTAALNAALPVLLDGLDREALAQVVFSWAVPNAGDFRDEHESVVERALAGADAVLAHLRDEFGVVTPKRMPTLTEDQLRHLVEHSSVGGKFKRPEGLRGLDDA